MRAFIYTERDPPEYIGSMPHGVYLAAAEHAARSLSCHRRGGPDNADDAFRLATCQVDQDAFVGELRSNDQRLRRSIGEADRHAVHVATSKTQCEA